MAHYGVPLVTVEGGRPIRERSHLLPSGANLAAGDLYLRHTKKIIVTLLENLEGDLRVLHIQVYYSNQVPNKKLYLTLTCRDGYRCRYRKIGYIFPKLQSLLGTVVPKRRMG